MNLAIIALLPRVFNLCQISMSSGLTGTSIASAILRIASSGKLYALSGIPWNSRELTLVGGEYSHHCAISAPIALIPKENSFQFNGRNYLQIYGTAMGTKMAVTFANIFWPTLKHNLIVSQSIVKPSVWKRYMDDIFSLWDTCKHDIERFIWQATSYHPTIKFTAEISNAEASFLDTVVYKGNRFHHHSILDNKMHFKRTETFFQYTHFSSSHPTGVKKEFAKGEALRILRTNSSETTFEENVNKEVNPQ